MHIEDGIDYRDLQELGFVPENNPGPDFDDDWFILGPVRVIVRAGGQVDVYLFTDDVRFINRAFVTIDGALPSTVYRQIIESVMSAEHE